MARRYFLTGVQVPFPFLDAARLGRPEGPGYRGAVGFSRAELESFRDIAVPDLVRPGVRLLFVGINPGLWTAATQTHFAHPGNRFYPALRLAGILDREMDRAAGMTEADRRYLVARGLGITNLVNRATARADELSPAELRAGCLRLTELVHSYRPRVVAVAGITAYRTAFSRPRAVSGEQPESLAGADLWVVPNPSGLNAHHTLVTLAEAYAAPARAAGLLESAIS
jgi:TDG/mug DNA glycosylase family protein